MTWGLWLNDNHPAAIDVRRNHHPASGTRANPRPFCRWSGEPEVWPTRAEAERRAVALNRTIGDDQHAHVFVRKVESAPMEPAPTETFIVDILSSYTIEATDEHEATRMALEAIDSEQPAILPDYVEPLDVRGGQ